MLGYYTSYPNILTDVDVDWYFNRPRRLRYSVTNTSIIDRLKVFINKIFTCFKSKKNYEPVIIELIGDKDLAKELFAVNTED